MESWMRNVKMMEQWIIVRRQIKQLKDEWSAPKMQLSSHFTSKWLLTKTCCWCSVISCDIWIDQRDMHFYTELSVFLKREALTECGLSTWSTVNVTCTAAGVRTVCQNAGLQESAYFQGTCLLMCVYLWMNTCACVKYIYVIVCTSCFLYFFSHRRNHFGCEYRWSLGPN